MLLWPLHEYKTATSTVKLMKAKINKYTWKWLGSPPGLSDVALYCRQVKLKLSFKSIVEESNQLSREIRLQMMLDDSKDEVIKSPKPTLKTEKKWKVRDPIRSAKDNLAFKEIIGNTQTNEKQRWSKTSGKNRRSFKM